MGIAVLLAPEGGAAEGEPGSGSSMPRERSSLSLLVSGHSLTETPYPSFVEYMLADRGTKVSVEVQHLYGSSIRQRLMQQTPHGTAVDQPADLQPPSLSDLVSERRFDVMIITEQHRLLDALLWEDTAGSLLGAHTQFISGNPEGDVHFFTPWISISDRARINDWIRYEQQAHVAWSCLVSDLNGQLDPTSKQKINLLPSALAIAFLTERMMSSQPPAAFRSQPVEARLAAVFRDEVHLTELGSYYLAHLTAWWLTGQPPEERPLLEPQEEDGRRSAMRQIVRDFAAIYRPGSGACTFAQRWAFIAQYVNYTDFYHRHAEESVLSTRMRQFTRALRFYWHFAGGFARAGKIPVEPMLPRSRI
jgi:hypothetical protein